MDSVLLEAKREYTEQVVSKIMRPLYDEIYEIWKTSLTEDSASPMRHFQDSLETLAKMDEKDMLVITDRCIQKTGCSYFGDLLTAIFVAHTRVLLSVRKENTKDGYRLQVPTPNRFLRACILSCAREFWKSPYLYYQNEQNNKITKIQVQKNLREAETIIKHAVRDTIRNLLPLKDVLDVAIVKGDTGDIVVEAEPSAKGGSADDTHQEDTKEDTKKDPEDTKKDPEDTKKDPEDTKKDPEDTKKDPDTLSGEEIDLQAIEITDGSKPAQAGAEKDDSHPAEGGAKNGDDKDILKNMTETDPIGDVISQVQNASASTELPAYEETDLTNDDDSVNSETPGWDTIEIKSPPDETILMESVSDAISLDPEPTSAPALTPPTTDADEIAIEAEEL